MKLTDLIIICALLAVIVALFALSTPKTSETPQEAEDTPPIVITEEEEQETEVTIFETEHIVIELETNNCGNAFPETTVEETILTTDGIETSAEITTAETEETFPLTDVEYKIAVKIVMLECGGCSYEVKLAVASVIYNRMELWDKTLKQVIYQQNAFSTARYVGKKTGKHYAEIPGMTDKLWQECYDAVTEVFTNGPTVPEKVIFFKTKNYHKRGIPYAKIGPLYFAYTP